MAWTAEPSNRVVSIMRMNASLPICNVFQNDDVIPNGHSAESPYRCEIHRTDLVLKDWS